MPRRPASTGALPRTPPKPPRLSQLEDISKLSSTPTHISTSSALFLKRKKSNLDPLLGMEVKELSTYVSVDTWMSAVSRFSQATLATWTAVIKDNKLFEDHTIKLALTKFCRSGELERYVPLSDLLNRLLVWAKDHRALLVDLPEEKDVDDLVYFRHDPLHMLGPKDEDVAAAQRKPDVVAARAAQGRRRTEDKSRVPWNQAILLFELKHDRNGRLVDKLQKRRKAGVAAKGRGKRKSTKPPPPPAAPAVAGGSTSRRGSESRKRPASTQDEVVQEPRKKSRSQPSATGPPPSGKDIETKESEEQMASYALEMAATTYGTRLHNIGIFMRDDKITFWYFDASGVVRTRSEPPLSLIDDFEKVAAIFIALSYSTAEQFGAFPPDIIRPPENGKYPAAFPPVNLTGYTIDLSPSKETALDGAPPLTTALGNGATPFVVTLEDPLFQQYVLFGRRTTVYSATTSVKAHQGIPLVVKLSQQVVTRMSEVTLIERAKKYGVTHIPKIYCSKDIYKLSDGIRELFVYEKEDAYEDRVLRCIVTDNYMPLCERLAQNPDSIKTMVRQMLTCIRDLRYDAHILHRDVSDSNIMWKEEDGKDWFILNDFDLAVVVNESGKPLGPTSRHRTGTLPFMSPELLQDMHAASLRPKQKSGESVDSVIHCVRMDYESTALVAIWSAIKTVKDGTSKSKQEADNYDKYLKSWESGTYESMALVKKDMLHDPDKAANLPLSPLFAHLNLWFDDLLQPFRKGEARRKSELDAAKKRARRGKDKASMAENPVAVDALSFEDRETMYGEVTFEHFRDVLDEYEEE